MTNLGEYRTQVAQYLLSDRARAIQDEVAASLLELDPDVWGLTDGRCDNDELDALRTELERLRAKPARQLRKCGPPKAAARGRPELALVG